LLKSWHAKQVIARHTSEDELRWLDDTLDELLDDLAADEC
jgi:hypothetical protein